MDWLLSLDRSAFFTINHFRNGFFDVFFYVCSLVGEYGIIWIALGILVIILDKKNGKGYFVLSMIALLLTVFIDDVLIKMFMFRERPYLALDNVYQIGERWKNSSFPSGHATATFASIVVIYSFYKKYFKWALAFGLVTLYARPYLGMHYPIDVLVGAVIGAFCGWVTMYFYNKLYHPKKSLTEKIFDFYHKLGWKIKWGALGIFNFAILLWFTIKGGAFGAILTLVLMIVCLSLYFLFEWLWKLMRRKHWKAWLYNTIFVILLILTLVVYVYGLLIVKRMAFDNGKLTADDKHLALIVLDGASLVNAKELFMEGLGGNKDYLTQMSQAFPNISNYFIQDGAFTANGISVWPSSSIPAHTAIVTGNYPRETGVMGQRQFNREQRKYTSYIGLGIQSHQYILNKSVKAICERFSNVRSLDVLQIANRGCSLYLPQTPHDEKVLSSTEQFMNTTDALSKFSGKSEMPKILVMTLPDIDHQTHNNKVSSEKSKKLYLHADEEVGRIIDLYKKKGLYDKTLFVLAADHGMGEVTNHVTLDNIVNDMRFNSYQSLKWKVIPAWGSFEANFYVGTKYKFNTAYNSVALWGGNSDAMIYLKGQKRDKSGKVVFESWDIKPSDEELKNYDVGGDKIDVIGKLFEYSPGIGLVFTNPQKGLFNVYSAKGQGQIKERKRNGQVEFSYQVISGTDPLGYSEHGTMAKYIKDGTFLSDQEWLRLTYMTHYPDALRRISYSLENDNSATMNIVASDGWDFAPYYVAKQVLSGSHGSLNAQQSLVPIMFHGPGVKKQTEMPFARTVDILPTILAYFDQPVMGTEGRVLPIFEDEAKNLTVGKANDYSTGKNYSCEGSSYYLKSIYGSYDKQLVKKIGNQETVVIKSLKKEFPSLTEKVNLSANIQDVQCGKEITLQEEYVAENKLGNMLTYSLLK